MADVCQLGLRSELYRPRARQEGQSLSLSRRGPGITLNLEPARLPAIATWQITRVPQSLHVIAADLRKPTSRLCPACFGLLRVLNDCFQRCDYCNIRPAQVLACHEAGCLQINRPVSCVQCTESNIPRLGSLPRRAKKSPGVYNGRLGFCEAPTTHKTSQAQNRSSSVPDAMVPCEAIGRSVPALLFRPKTGTRRAPTINPIQSLAHVGGAPTTPADER